MTDTDGPLIVGFGGTTREASSTEQLLRGALAACERAGGRTRLFDGPFLARLPHYGPERSVRVSEATELIDAIRSCQGVVIASPGYHGCMSGLVKNAIDYLEDLRDDPAPYLSGRAVGCLAAAGGWQAANAALMALRSAVHALRAWPTPLGAAMNTNTISIGDDGRVDDPHVSAQLESIGAQVVGFARRGPVP
ncbi:MAG: NADPH-dependent FMN reductase [Egibacteraceae bacterium]